MNKLNNNTIELQAILDAVNALPEAGGEGEGGVVLPELTNEGSASDLLSGKELINSSGNIVIGTIPTKTSNNLSTNGATVTVPAGYYASQATKSIASGSAVTPASTITKNPSISVDSSGLITASVSGTQSVTPTVTAGYVSSGTAGTITVNGSATKQLTTKSAITITPTKSIQIAATSGVYTTGAISVAPIPSEYIVPSGTKNITTNGTHDVTANASVSVNVPIPDGYIQPSGTLDITENGTYDVTDKASVSVEVTSGGGGVDDSMYTEAVIAQTELIDELTQILSTKANPSTTNMGTCKVIVEVPAKANHYICREHITDGAITYNLSRNYTNTDITLTSVRCDSILYVATGVKAATATDGEVVKVISGQGVVYKTPSLNNSIAILTLTN